MKKQPQGFKKFIQTEEKGSIKKERIRQEKKAMRKETQEYFAKKKEEAKQSRATGNTTSKAKWGSRGNEGADRIEKKKFSKSEDSKERGGRTFKKNDTGNSSYKGASKGKRSFKSNDREDRNQQGDSRGGFKKKGGFKKSSGLGPRAFKKAGGYKAMSRDAAGFEEKTKGFKKEIPAAPKDQEQQSPRFKNTRFTDRNPYQKNEEGSTEDTKPSRFDKTEKPAFKKREGGSEKTSKPKSNFASRIEGAGPQTEKSAKNTPGTARKKIAVEKTEETPEKPAIVNTGTMPLNKFIAHAGVCSRRDAADIVRSGKVVVNGETVTEPGFKVSGKDEIKVNGKKIAVRRNLVYILLNKPKDYITTTEDPQGRKTVLDIIRNATTERVYPIGRLDRNTTGVLLLTNDGELAQKLSHPSYEIKKIYEVTLDKPLTKKDFDSIIGGVNLEDGFIQPDALAYADSKDKAVIGIEIHSGRNRIVRRIFEHMGYDVRNLDRVMYANLTKKNVDRGKWRLLTEKEVRLLKYLNASYTNKNKPARRG
ncbi:pseudouridine synthase [Pseudobacter ginsenosidimutans]|uniref:Pseudouridine synthase n=1 Tax=Pseudobacter ginsenosidimutans TaxID=661488 RepID=A0A4V2F163_9BACT|nr:pseudouridine synthase [Pseudobacter ginsenosidimutans]RZS72531.1 23S rRNA pseudouridine2605 synthase [Pseudobacter ginsenosidimutans]